MKKLIIIFLISYGAAKAQVFRGDAPSEEKINPLAEFLWRNPANDTSVKWQLVVRTDSRTKKYLKNLKNQSVSINRDSLPKLLRDASWVKVVGGDVATPNVILDILLDKVLVKRLHLVLNLNKENDINGGMVNLNFGYGSLLYPKNFATVISNLEIIEK